MDCVLETKPLQLSADYAVKLKVEPIEVHYDSVSHLCSLVAVIPSREGCSLRNDGGDSQD